MSKLWQKESKKPSGELEQFIEEFTVGNDHQLDMAILPFDLTASEAHAKGLFRIGLITEKELNTLIEGLGEIKNKLSTGEFVVTREQEDGHTAIEQFLTDNYGEVGKKIHTGRSRNDQVLTALRLYEKHHLQKVFEESASLTEAFLTFAETHEWVPMPGYTHMQPAMISSVGMWAASYAEMLILSLINMRQVSELIDYCPLGSAAGFGVNLNLPREYVSDLLGFKEPITVATTAQNSRGKLEASVLNALTFTGSVVSQFASDLLLFTTREYEFFSFKKDVHTGSSIMPQKQNLDIAELIRGHYATLIGEELKLKNLTARLTSGYQRDLQLTKEPVLKTFELLKQMVKATLLLVENLRPDLQKLQGKCYKELFATDYANDLVKKGAAFRDAYREAANHLHLLEISPTDLQNHLKTRKHLGSSGNLGLQHLKRRFSTIKNSFT